MKTQKFLRNILIAVLFSIILLTTLKLEASTAYFSSATSGTLNISVVHYNSITGFNLARINADLGGVKPRNITILNMYNGKLVSSISNQAFKGGNQFINSHLLFLLRTSRSCE